MKHQKYGVPSPFSGIPLDCRVIFPKTTEPQVALC